MTNWTCTCTWIILVHWAHRPLFACLALCLPPADYQVGLRSSSNLNGKFFQIMQYCIALDKSILIIGDISSYLYRPQSQDEIVEFSFFVVLSYESNLQLGCFWWKISTSSLKTFFYKFCAYFCKSHVQTWELRFSKIYMIEGWWVKKNALSHSHFHYW